MKKIALMLALMPSAAASQGYSEHQGVTAYRDKPCTHVVGTIDGQTTIQGAATQAMLWGFLLGFDQANGGLQGPEETTLIRLRKACAESPKTPALELLKGFTG